MPLLHPEEQVFAAMLDGWRAQQLARNLAFSTIGRREAMMREFAVRADALPWRVLGLAHPHLRRALDATAAAEMRPGKKA